MRRLTILFVDSDLNTHTRMQLALQNGCTLCFAFSVAEAKQFLEVALPDILISDVVLRGQENGLDLCRYIRSRPGLQNLPIMLLTSLDTLQDKIAGFDAGTDDYVVKPFDTRHLLARIRLLARIKRIQQQL